MEIGFPYVAGGKKKQLPTRRMGNREIAEKIRDDMLTLRMVYANRFFL
ncbi:MAG: hypothetical protein LKI94_08545 [Sporolactobacillus sp.]|nr:hypothetical protein [Sporolactobacillus sp.]MCI1882223.1 hypothetical protein [Sporolactobacillus sp.]